MGNQKLQRIGMLSGIPQDSETLQTVADSELPVEKVNPTTDLLDDFLPNGGAYLPEIPMPTDDPEVPGSDPTDPDPEEPGEGGEGDGEEYELVKEKPVVADKHKFVRMVLIALALFVAYRLFFSKRR